MADESDDRWTVRGVGKSLRDAAAEAAHRRKVSVGAWLCGAIDREIRAEREPLDMQVLGQASAMSAKLSASDARLVLIERTIAAAVSLANAPDVPTGFRRRANRLLREALPAAAINMPAGANSRRRIASEVRACRSCGCTDNDCSGCISRTGQPCHWVTQDLCSACASAHLSTGADKAKNGHGAGDPAAR